MLHVILACHHKLSRLLEMTRQDKKRGSIADDLAPQVYRVPTKEHLRSAAKMAVFIVPSVTCGHAPLPNWGSFLWRHLT